VVTAWTRPWRRSRRPRVAEGGPVTGRPGGQQKPLSAASVNSFARKSLQVLRLEDGLHRLQRADTPKKRKKTPPSVRIFVQERGKILRVRLTRVCSRHHALARRSHHRARNIARFPSPEAPQAARPAPGSLRAAQHARTSITAQAHPPAGPALRHQQPKAPKLSAAFQLAPPVAAGSYCECGVCSRFRALARLDCQT